jgi:hypothetical protein
MIETGVVVVVIVVVIVTVAVIPGKVAIKSSVIEFAVGQYL